MGQPRIKWGMIERYFVRRGYEIKGSGGDRIIIAPRTSDTARTRNQVRIGHTSCSSAGTEVLHCYVQAIRRAFGVTAEDILND